MSEQTRATKKKGTVILIAVLASILGAVMITFLILGLIPVKAFARDEIMDYLYVNIYDQGNERIASVRKDAPAGEAQEYSKLLKEGLEGSSYTLLRSALEFSYVNNPRFKTEEVTDEEIQYDEDGYPERDDTGEFVTKTVTTTQRVEVAGNQIVGSTQAIAANYVLEFVYSEQRQPGTPGKKITIEGEEIEFDRVRVVIFDSKNTIEKFEVYFYDSNKINIDDPSSQEVVVVPVEIRANTSKLYAKLGEIKKLITGSEANGEETEE